MKPPELGDVVYEFRPDQSNVMAGYVLGALALGGAGYVVYQTISALVQAKWTLPWYLEKGFSWFAVGLAVGLTTFLVVTGCYLLWWMNRLRWHRVVIRAEGFQYITGARSADVQWADVARIEESKVWQRLPIMKGPASQLIPKTASLTYTVRCKDDRTFAFDDNSIRHVSHLGALLKTAAMRGGLEWQTEELNA